MLTLALGQHWIRPVLRVSAVPTMSIFCATPTIPCHRFAPSVNVLLYHGTREERAELRAKHLGGSVGPGWPVIVTSFEVVLNDRKKFQKRTWKYLVVDEVGATCRLLHPIFPSVFRRCLLCTCSSTRQALCCCVRHNLPTG